MDYNLGKTGINPELLGNIMQNNILLYFAVLLLVFRIATVFVYVNFPQNIFFADITKIALENFANETRQSMGLTALVENQKLNEAARMKAENMVKNNYFAHTSPTGVSPWHWFSEAGYNYKYAGENLAVGFYESEEVYNAWLNSPLHRENILNPNYKEVGTAVLFGFGPNNAVVVVQEFASPMPVKQTAVQLKPEPKAPQPVVKPVEPDIVTNTQEKVLSQTIEIDARNISYGAVLSFIGILLLMIFLNPGFVLEKKLVFRSALIVILLSLATLADKELILLIIPHTITI
jgi:hypothetical protein